MKSSRKLSEERSFPSTLMERGTSGRRLTAAFRKASAGGVDGEREKRGRKNVVEATRKKIRMGGNSQRREKGKGKRDREREREGRSEKRRLGEEMKGRKK